MVHSRRFSRYPLLDIRIAYRGRERRSPDQADLQHRGSASTLEAEERWRRPPQQQSKPRAASNRGNDRERRVPSSRIGQRAPDRRASSPKPEHVVHLSAYTSLDTTSALHSTGAGRPRARRRAAPAAPPLPRRPTPCTGMPMMLYEGHKIVIGRLAAGPVRSFTTLLERPRSARCLPGVAHRQAVMSSCRRRKFRSAFTVGLDVCEPGEGSFVERLHDVSRP